MECKILEHQDIELMKNFIDDENTEYTEENLAEFINEKNAYGFIIKNETEIVGFAYGYILVRPDGKKIFIFMLLMLWKNIRATDMEQN